MRSGSAEAESQEERTAGTARRAGALGSLAAMPIAAIVLTDVTWSKGGAVARTVEHAPSLALSTVTLADLLALAAGAVGAATSAYLSLAALLLVATPHRSRARTAVVRLTPAGWRRVVSLAAAGALSSAMAFPAAAAPDNSDAGWVPEPITKQAGTLDPPATFPVLPIPGARHAERPAPDEHARAPVQSPIDSHYTVATGDSLWSITADALKGEVGDGAASPDNARIAAAWPALFEANLESVGSNPALIHPGQRLTLPEGWPQ
ncbi:LysM peptidoglycan-binding domain-containing protein [Demequina sp. SO4-13]